MDNPVDAESEMFLGPSPSKRTRKDESKFKNSCLICSKKGTKEHSLVKPTEKGKNTLFSLMKDAGDKLYHELQKSGFVSDNEFLLEILYHR